jgi:hypothetical protein
MISLPVFPFVRIMTGMVFGMLLGLVLLMALAIL